MATMQVRLNDLAIRVATECKSLRTLLNGNAASLNGLSTTNKTSVVAAINELKTTITALQDLTGGFIDDNATASTSKTWSMNKIAIMISAGITDALDDFASGAPALLNTINEIAAALGDDANFAVNMTTALTNRVRTDVNTQGLTTQQKANARTNIDAFGSVELGNPDADLVAIFVAGLI